MCSTCDFTKYNKTDTHLEYDLGMPYPRMFIRCSHTGKNYQLVTTDGERENKFKMYRCITCGKILEE